MMWGSNVPVTRTPDAHWMAEVRYRGTKVVTVSPDYADNTKFADEWLPAQAGTDAALAMAMGHVMLKEFFVDREVPFFADYVRQYTDLPFLVRLERRDDGALVPGQVPHRRGPRRPSPAAEDAAWKTVLFDEATGRPVVPNGSMGFRYAESRRGQVEPRPRGRRPGAVARGEVLRGERRGAAAVLRGRRTATGSVLRRGVPGPARSAGQLVTTVFDLMLAQYGVGRDGLPGRLAAGYDDAATPVHPGLAGGDHLRPGAGLHPDRPRVRPQRRGVRGPVHDHHGRRHLPVVPRRRHLPGDPVAVDADRLHGPQRRRLGALRRPGKVPADHRLAVAGQRAGLVPAAADHDRHRRTGTCTPTSGGSTATPPTR